MKLFINGKPHPTTAKTLLELQQEQHFTISNCVMIYNGYQTKEDFMLQENDEIIFIEKGIYPSEEQMEAMLYARNTPSIQKKLKQAKVAVAGLGGLGSHIAISLARLGVGQLHLVDFDVVEPSNLNRQQCKIKHLGMAKTEALQQEISEINPYITVIIDTLMVTAENAAKLFSQDELVCEAFDQPENKAMLVNTLLTSLPHVKIVASSGMAGFESSNEITTKKVNSRFYVCGDNHSEAQPGCGLMAPRVSICAGHQANMALRLILGIEES